MKKSLLISASLLTLSVVTGIYAQTTTGSSIVEKMKAAAQNFTLSALLNPGETGLQSAPVKGKKTGDILTAGEYNRILELLSEGGLSASGGSGAAAFVTYRNFGGTTTTIGKSEGIQSVSNANGIPNFLAKDTLITFDEALLTGDYAVIVSPSEDLSAILSGSRPTLDWVCMWNKISDSSLGVRCAYPGYGAYGNSIVSVAVIKRAGGGGASGTSSGGGATIVEGGIIKTSPKTISNWDLITLEGSWNSGGGDAAPTGGYIYKINGQAKLAYVEASGISKDIVLTTTAQNVHNLTVKLSGNDVVIDPSSSNTLAYLVWKFGSGGTAFYKCTNAQSLDSTNAPCYGASRNGGAGTNQYRVVSCSNTDASGTYTAGGLLNFGDFMANKWSFHINNSNLACTDGSVLVMDIQGSGSASSTSSSWTDVSLIGNTPFDKTCEYRFHINAAGIDGVYYASIVHAGGIIYVAHNQTSHINADSKTVYRLDGVVYYTVSKIEKRCN